MKLSRIERTAKEAMELAEYVYNNRDVEFVEILPALRKGNPHTLTLWCTGSLTVEITVFGTACDIDLYLDDAPFETATGRVWKTNIERLGRTRHTLTFEAKDEAEEVRLRIVAKGGLRI